MNQTDKDFLRAMMHERMTLHYAAAHQKNSSSVQRFAALEDELNKVLSSLTEEQSEVVHQYMEHLFERSAESEELYFRCGFLDGYRLRDYLDTLTADCFFQNSLGNSSANTLVFLLLVRNTKFLSLTGGGEAMK